MSQKAVEIILMRQLASYLAMPIIVVAADGALVYYNEPAETIVGRRFDETGELTFDEWTAIFEPRDDHGVPLPKDIRPIAVALSERRPSHHKFWITGLDGIPRRIEATAFPIEGLNGRHLGAVAILWASVHP
jgi:PAS domain-containing protein